MATGMFSTKGMYALRAMADLASHEGWVSLGDVSKRQNISRKYLEQVISLMHKAGYVQSQRGKGGGYKLTRKPEEYTLGELLRAAEGSLAPVGCLDCSNGTICPQMGSCSTVSVWRATAHAARTARSGASAAAILPAQRRVSRTGATQARIASK